MGLLMAVLGILPMFFWTGLDTPVLLRGFGCFCLLFGLTGGVLFILSGGGMLSVAAGYSLALVLILLPRAPEITNVAAVGCLAGGIGLFLFMNHYPKKRKKGSKEKRSFHQDPAQQGKRYTAAKGGRKASLSPKVAAIQKRMGYVQCSVLFAGVLCFVLSMLAVLKAALWLALATMVLAAAWGVMQMVIWPELQALPAKKRYCAYPVRMDPTVQLILGIASAALLLLHAAGEIIWAWEMLLIPGAFAVVAGMCAFLRSRENTKLRMGAIGMAVFFTLVVGGLGLMAANYVLPAQRTEYVAQVTSKHKSGGKTTSYRLVCDSPAGEIRLQVSRNRYDRQQVGDLLHIREYDGALFMGWRSLIATPEE